MQTKTPAEIGDDRQAIPPQAFLGFLSLLNRVSNEPAVLEYCTPGHRAGRGFGIFLAQAEPQSKLKQSDKERT